MSTDRSQGASRESNSGRLSVRLSPRLLSRIGAAVEDGPYHSRSHLVRAALQLLLPPADDRRSWRSQDPPEVACRKKASTDEIRVRAIHEVFPDEERSPRLKVEVVDGRDRGSPATHTFVYDVDRSSRSVSLRTYEPPSRLTHERIGSLGVLRELARETLEARNWRVQGSPGGVERTAAPSPR